MIFNKCFYSGYFELGFLIFVVKSFLIDVLFGLEWGKFVFGFGFVYYYVYKFLLFLENII